MVPELTRQQEAILFKDATSKEDYMNMVVDTSDQRPTAIIRSHPVPRHMSSSSSITKMKPTPGMTQSAGTRSIVSCHANNSVRTATDGMVAQMRTSMGNLLPVANGSTGAVANRHQRLRANSALCSGGASIMPPMGMSQPLSQMIPTPGLSNSQLIAMNSACPNGVGVSRMDSSFAPQKQQQKQYIGNQNSHILHTLGGQMGAGSMSNFQKMSPSYGFSNGVVNGRYGLLGNNTQLENEPSASEGYLNAASYGFFPKPLQKQYCQQSHHSISASLSQQMLPMPHGRYSMNPELSGSENLYGSASAFASEINMQSMRHPESKANNPLLTSTTRLQPTHLLQPRRAVQNFQQQGRQPYVQLVQQQPHLQSPQQQQIILENDTLRQLSVNPRIGIQLIPEHGTSTCNESLPQAVGQFNLLEYQNHCHQSTSTGTHPEGAQGSSHLSDAQDCQPSPSCSSQQLFHMQRQSTESEYSFNGLVNGAQPNAFQQGYCHPQPIQKPQLSDKSSPSLLGEAPQKPQIGQEEACCATDHVAAIQSISAPQPVSRVARIPKNLKRERDFSRQRKWLLLLIHASKCPSPKGTCKEGNCITVQNLILHMKSCNLDRCNSSRCVDTKNLWRHFRNCREAGCPVCPFVRDFVASHPLSHNGLLNHKGDPRGTANMVGEVETATSAGAFLSETPEDLRPLKRMKVQPTCTSLVHKDFVASHPLSHNGLLNHKGGPRGTANMVGEGDTATSAGAYLSETPEDLRPLKRMKVQPTCMSLVHKDFVASHPLSHNGLLNHKGGPRGTANMVGEGSTPTSAGALFSETPEDLRPLKRMKVQPACTSLVHKDFMASHPLNHKGGPRGTANMVGEVSMPTSAGALLSETPEDLRPLKRMKVQTTCTSLVHKESSPVSTTFISQPLVLGDTQPQLVDTTMSTESVVADVKIDVSVGCASIHESVDTGSASVEPFLANEVVGHAKQENMLTGEDTVQVKMEVKQEANAPTSDPVAGSKSGKTKIKGVSLTELLTPDQIREHIVSLRRWDGQSKAKAEKYQAMGKSENSCQLCAVENLTFEPLPLYCTPCGTRIKRNAPYYTNPNGDPRYYFCIPCYNENRGDAIKICGTAYPKKKLEKKKNDEDTTEAWVLCDKCHAWQHQICALFNIRRNNADETEYTCPNCYIKEIENGERKPLEQSAVLGAKDLPTTILSDHIEQRLFRQLKKDRQERARQHGKKFDEVPGAEALVVRVVSSIDKKLEVKPNFLEIFKEENYPTAFPYKSKVILLFQKIEGVEVCIFGMYVQEFGSECQFPNQRRVYLSYLDSVKYFRPEIKAATGEALRTFVYHEILIGYLEYCKKRGFCSCYIWACPPVKGEDYILYCHPEIQKTPKSDKLREWYLSMLRKATKEEVVVELTNLHDHFFLAAGECKAKVTAARLPYFEGDYWPGAAEDMINQLRQEEENDRNQQKKGKPKKALTKRALKAAGQINLGGNASKDALLMHKLGHTIQPMREDFIMVHLQYACKHCCLPMVSGTRWYCKQCKNFQLCDKCHVVEQRLEEKDRHPINRREKHTLYPDEIKGVPANTKDEDEILESEFFDTRQAFLNLCQGNHYQYDTLRRAKHSSMMVLYHLHNPTAPAFAISCNICQHDIETGQGWRCEVCPDFEICNDCYREGRCADHPHKLMNHSSMAVRSTQNKKARKKLALQTRHILNLLVHASRCAGRCPYPNCGRVKRLFRHSAGCQKRMAGGCPYCLKIWDLLKRHARGCRDLECLIPRCKELREHMRRFQQQSDFRRRAAMDEMVRERAAEQC